MKTPSFPQKNDNQHAKKAKPHQNAFQANTG